VKKEHNVCVTLKNWFESFGVECWLNEGSNKFQTKLSQKKPDMIIYSDRLNQYIAIEVKPGDNKTAISNGFKILDYWKEYVDGDIQYFIENEEIKISSFCFATIGAMNGKIYLDDNILKDSVANAKTEWQKCQVKHGLEPRFEYAESKKYIRNVWGAWRTRAYNRKKEYQPGVGVILADILNSPSIDSTQLHITHPLLFDMQWRMAFRDKMQWRQKNFRL